MNYYETYDTLLEDIAEPEVEALGSYDEFDDWSDKYIREDWRLRDSIRDYIGVVSF